MASEICRGEAAYGRNRAMLGGDLVSQFRARSQHYPLEKGFGCVFVCWVDSRNGEDAERIDPRMVLVLMDDDVWALKNEEAKSMDFYRVTFCRPGLSQIDASQTAHDCRDDDRLAGMGRGLGLDAQRVVIGVVFLHDLGLYLCPVVEVGVSRAGRLQLAGGASSMGSFETSPCNTWNHARMRL
jgi:hypothetical protein